MAERIEKPELVTLAAQRTNHEPGLVEQIVDGLLKEICAALKRGESVSLRNFGSFYVREERASWVFKFIPSQRLRKAFGWSSTYRGDL
jgi:DNA-binding protein HU-beta